MLGCDAVRLSVPGDDGQEFFVIAPLPNPGRSYREFRQKVFVAICEAIDDGEHPGEVKMDLVH